MSLIDKMRKAASECPFGSTAMDVQVRLDVVLEDIPPMGEAEEKNINDMCETVVSERVPFPPFKKRIPFLFYRNGNAKFAMQIYRGDLKYIFMDSKRRFVTFCPLDLQLSLTSELRKIANIIFPLVKVKKMNGQDLIMLISSICK